MLLLLCITCTKAQITFDQAAISNWTPGKDTLAEVIVPYYSIFNPLWDFSGSQYGAMRYKSYSPTTGSPTFPEVTYSLEDTVTFGNRIKMKAEFLRGNTTSGIKTFGRAIGRYAYPLTGLSAVPTDSIIFDAPAMAYTSPEIHVKFPTTVSSFAPPINWVSSYSVNTPFMLTCAAYGIFNQSGYIRTDIVVKDTMGYQIDFRLKDLNGQVTGLIAATVVGGDVLQTDSFFLNGASFSNYVVIDAIGASQGPRPKRRIGYFYQPTQVTPLLTTEFYASRMDSIVSQQIMVSKLTPASAGIAGTQQIKSEINVYPNPVTTDFINVDFKDNSLDKWDYSITNIAGGLVSSGTLKRNGHIALISKHEVRTPGIYTLSLYKNGVRCLSEALIISF